MLIKSKLFSTKLSILILLLSSFAATSLADEWPQFRGPGYDGVAKSKFPESWSVTENVRWEIPVAGEGWSCPIVWGDRVILTAAVPTGDDPGPIDSYRPDRGTPSELSKFKYRWEVICVDKATGKLRWKQSPLAGSPRLPRHQDNSYATETPVTDGQRIVVYFGMMGLYCYDMDGNLQWEKDLGNYEMRAGWGTSSSPVLFEDRVLLQIDNEQQSFVVALDAKSGDELWRADREEPSQYSSPVIWQNSLRTELVTGGEVCRSYDPETGRVLWELDMEKGRSSSTPLVVGDRLFVGTEFRNRGGSDDGGGYLFAVRPTEDGIKIDWKSPDSGIQMASPVLANDHLYLFERRSGTLHCINASTGKKAYRQRVPGARAFWASPVVQDDKVFALDDAGTTHVIASGSEFRVLRRNVLGERTWSTPAISNGALFIRTSHRLFCIAD